MKAVLKAWLTFPSLPFVSFSNTRLSACLQGHGGIFHMNTAIHWKEFLQNLTFCEDKLPWTFPCSPTEMCCTWQPTAAAYRGWRVGWVRLFPLLHTCACTPTDTCSSPPPQLMQYILLYYYTQFNPIVGASFRGNQFSCCFGSRGLLTGRQLSRPAHINN